MAFLPLCSAAATAGMAAEDERAVRVGIALSTT
jgi:hypothetical protein